MSGRVRVPIASAGRADGPVSSVGCRAVDTKKTRRRRLEKVGDLIRKGGHVESAVPKGVALCLL